MRSSQKLKILKEKQSDMEVVINRQDNLICKINEENMVLKSKLFAIEFLMQDNPRCDENNDSREPLQSAEPNDKSQECEQMININLPTINTVISVNTNKTPLRENNGMVISTNNCISDSSNNSISTVNSIQYDAGVSLANSLSQPKPKNLVPCPFLRRRGYCLKGSRCDFLHNDTPSSTSGVQSPFRQNPISAYPFSYVPPPNSSQNPLSFEPTFFPRLDFPGFFPRTTPSHPLLLPPPTTPTPLLLPPPYYSHPPTTPTPLLLPPPYYSHPPPPPYLYPSARYHTHLH